MKKTLITLIILFFTYANIFALEVDDKIEMYNKIDIKLEKFYNKQSGLTINEQEKIYIKISEQISQLKNKYKSGNIRIALDYLAERINNKIESIKKGYLLSADGLNSKGVEYFDKEDYNNAIIYYKKALELSPKNPIYNYNYGLAEYFIGNYEKAIDGFTVSINYENKNNTLNLSESYSRRGASYYEIFQDEKALADLNKSLDLNPNDLWGLYFKAEVLRLKGEYKEALSYINKYIDLDDTNYSAYSVRGDIYYSQFDYDKAYSDYYLVSNMNPEDENSYFYMGHIKYYDGNFRFAYELYKKSAEINPKGYLNNFYTGYMAYRLDDISNAKYYIKKAYENEDGNKDEAVKLYYNILFNNTSNNENLIKLKDVFQEKGYDEFIKEVQKFY